MSPSTRPPKKVRLTRAYSSGAARWNDAVNRFRTLLAAPAAAVDARDAEPMFYVQDTRQFVGNCVMWWGKNCSGYVTHLNEAGKYTLDEASRICERDTDRMWPCEQIDAPAHPTVVHA